MNLLLSGLGYWVWIFAKSTFVHFLAGAFAGLNFLLVVVNLVFVFPLDGYFIVREISGDQNLQKNSLVFFILMLTILVNRLTFGKVILGKGENKASSFAEKKDIIKSIPLKRKFFYICFSITEILFFLYSVYFFAKLFEPIFS